MRQPVLSIRNVVTGLGLFSVAIALCLAGFGLFATHLQGTSLDRIILLQTALHNHETADGAMDNLRTDILRSLQAAAGANLEDKALMDSDVGHHADTLKDGIANNLELPLSADLHNRYVPITTMVSQFTAAALNQVDIAYNDPLAGAHHYEAFRTMFTALEDEMDAARDALDSRLAEAATEGVAAGALSRNIIMGSLLAGAVVLVLTTMAAIRVVRRITLDLASSRAEAHRLSLHDPLTGLPNRALFAERAAQALGHVRQRHQAAAMLCVDLDRFKQVNDTLGHSIGDALLRTVADRLRANVRECDTVARLGGDEFAVIQIPVNTADEAGSLALRLIEALSEPYDLAGHQVMIGASVGVALAPHDTLDGDELLKMADLALYRAKSDGRGTFCCFESGMDSKLQARRRLEADLRSAIHAQEFELHYQPLIEIDSGAVAGFEALVRWRHPDRGLVPPNEFIPVAEDTGLIGPLGIWVLQQACTDAATWPSSVWVAVNISPMQFRGGNLTAAVFDALAAAKLEPGRLELEITETALLTDAESTLATLGHLRAFGVRIAMDDFGTGYSSLGYLRRFPFDTIKIDQSFVRDIETSIDCKSIVRAVAGLGTSLGISITAEGVETLEQLQHLRAEGCDLVQGYYFSRPVPAPDVPALLDAYAKPGLHAFSQRARQDPETALS